MSEKKVIMQVLPSLEMGGVERGAIEIATALQAQGIPNIVVSAGGKMVAGLDKIGVEHITLPVDSKNPITMWLNGFRIAKIARKKGVGLMHVRSRAPAWSVKWASQKTGIPFITTFHGFYGLKPRWFKLFYNNVMTQGKKIIAVSDFIARHIIKEYGVNPDKIVRIHRGADTDYFNPARVSVKQVSDVFNQFKIPLGMPVISLVGRLSIWKGHTVLLQALSMMRNKEVVCLFVGGKGGKTLTEEIKRQIDLLPKETYVQIIETCSDMPAAYALSDVVVSASTAPETFGRVAVEAGAMGRIVVATNHGGSCETVVDGQTGFLVPPSDAKALADKLDMVLEMAPAERQKMQEAALEHIQADFSTAAMADRTIRLYRQLLEEKV